VEDLQSPVGLVKESIHVCLLLRLKRNIILVLSKESNIEKKSNLKMQLLQNSIKFNQTSWNYILEVLRIGFNGYFEAPRGVVFNGGVDVHQHCQT